MSVHEPSIFSDTPGIYVPLVSARETSAPRMVVEIDQHRPSRESTFSVCTQVVFRVPIIRSQRGPWLRISIGTAQARQPCMLAEYAFDSRHPFSVTCSSTSVALHTFPVAGIPRRRRIVKPRTRDLANARQFDELATVHVHMCIKYGIHRGHLK